MIKDNLQIRLEKEEEFRDVENLVRDSFWNVYMPGALEPYVLHTLRDNPDFIKELDLVLLRDDEIIGQVIAMKAHIKSDDGRIIPIITMGPLAIRNDLKRQGYGSFLMEYAINKAKKLGFTALCFEGNYDFYKNVGLKHGKDFGLRYHDIPENSDQSFFLAMELIPGFLNNITGTYYTPDGYYVDKDAADKFDSTFPYKEKLKLDTQIF